MDSVFNFGYNLFLVIAYTAAVSFMICFCLAKRRRPWGSLAGLFSFFLVDTVIIYFTESVPGFADWYNRMFVSIPAIKTVIYLGIAFFTFQSWNAYLHQNFTPLQGAAMILLGLWYLFIPLLGHGAVKAWLYYSAYQVFLFVLGAFALRRIKNWEAANKPVYKEIHWLLSATMAFSLLILLEDTFVIFNLDSYEGARIYIQGRSYTEDVLRILYTFLTVRFFRSGLVENDAGQPAHLSHCAAVRNQETDTADNFQKRSYADGFYLTMREQEVLFLILENKSNQEICETLHISIGTVKAHIHNIFRKADVTHRSELLRNYYIFLNKASA